MKQLRIMRQLKAIRGVKAARQFILLSLLFTYSAFCSAQTCSKNDPIFKSDVMGEPKEVRQFGANPEFKFLRNLSSSDQVAAAMKKANKENRRGAMQLNNMLMDIGFANGIKDLKASNIQATYIPDGTTGNMGDGNFGTEYSKLMSKSGRGVKAWKITSDGGCEMYVLAPCGNAFYPVEGKTKTACVTAPLDFKVTNQVSLTSNGIATSTDRVFIYFHRKKHKAHEENFQRRGLDDDNPSKPLLLSSTSYSESIPAKYRVTVTPSESSVSVCTDSALVVTPNINVEKVSDYAGRYPDKSRTTYKRVSKHVYHKTLKKITKSKRKQSKAEYLSKVNVNLCKS